MLPWTCLVMFEPRTAKASPSRPSRFRTNPCAHALVHSPTHPLTRSRSRTHAFTQTQRYSRYFGEFLEKYYKPGRLDAFSEEGHMLKITSVRMSPEANFDNGGGCDPYFKLFLPDGQCVYNMDKDKKVKTKVCVSLIIKFQYIVTVNSTNYCCVFCSR